MKRPVCVIVFLLILGGIGLAQEIKVTQPAADVVWNVGGTYVVQWTATGTTKPTVKIMLWQGGTHIMDIADGAPNSGSYSWTIPSTVAPGTYKVRVRTIGDNIVGIGAAFNIGAASTTTPIKVARPIDPGDRAGLRLKFPALSISNVLLTPNAEGFVVTFGYKNSGTGPLPKGSEMPVKPDFRVLIDNKEVGKGSLFIPEFPAPPGWEVQTYHGCFIKVPPAPNNFDFSWTIGNLVTVKINENAVNGMASDAQSYNLKPMALNYSYDALITGVTLDWAKEILTVHVRIDGKIGTLRTLMVVNDKPFGQFAKYIDISDGQRTHTITQKLDGLRQWWQEYKGRLWVLLKANKDAYGDRRDIEHRNNEYNYSYHR